MSVPRGLREGRLRDSELGSESTLVHGRGLSEKRLTNKIEAVMFNEEGEPSDMDGFRHRHLHDKLAFR